MANDEMLFVHPLPRHLSAGYDHNKEQLPHLVVKRSAKDFEHDRHQTFESDYEGLLF